jgi:type VI protein secretion system component Hcp
MLSKSSSSIVASLLAVSLLAAPHVAHADLFLSAPGVTGDSRTLPNRVDVLTLQFCVNGHAGTRPQFTDVTITKHPDSSSSVFVQAAGGGPGLSSVTISVTKSDGKTQQVAAEFTLIGVTVTGYTYADSGATGVVSTRSALDSSTETITLSFQRMEWKLAGVTPTGKAAPGNSGSWNVLTGPRS